MLNNTCAGCCQPIKDKFIFSVIDKSWHQDCLKCQDCQCKLNVKCYTREDKIYCQQDYFKRFSTTKCAGCFEGISPKELVQRYKENKVFHLNCFTCDYCKKRLIKGEQYYVIEELDDTHYDDELTDHNANQTSLANESNGAPSNKTDKQQSSTGQTSIANNQQRQQQQQQPQPQQPQQPQQEDKKYNVTVSNTNPKTNTSAKKRNQDLIIQQNRTDSDNNNNTALKQNQSNTDLQQDTNNATLTKAKTTTTARNIKLNNNIKQDRNTTTTITTTTTTNTKRVQKLNRFICKQDYTELMNQQQQQQQHHLQHSQQPFQKQQEQHAMYNTQLPPPPLIENQAAIIYGANHSNNQPTGPAIHESPPAPRIGALPYGDSPTVQAHQENGPSPFIDPPRTHLYGPTHQGGPGASGQAPVVQNVLSGSALLYGDQTQQVQNGPQSPPIQGVTPGALYTESQQNQYQQQQQQLQYQQHQIQYRNQHHHQYQQQQLQQIQLQQFQQQLQQTTNQINNNDAASNQQQSISSALSSCGSNDGAYSPLSSIIGSSQSQANSVCHSDSGGGAPNSGGCNTGDGGDGGGTGSSNGGGNNGAAIARNKRMRTSFKHHQLKAMKLWFSRNQNPDAKDLKQLAQQTGLSKRVLQVWFQNARAKDRRNNLRNNHHMDHHIQHVQQSQTACLNSCSLGINYCEPKHAPPSPSLGAIQHQMSQIKGELNNSG